jgi:two-component system response regulator AlgR
MKILIADDEALARSRLHAMLDELGDHDIIGEAASGEEVLQLCRQQAPDVVLLDIRMPGMDGLEAASHISKLEPPPAVIFTTAYSDHALEAFKTHAVDYLLKPIRMARLQEALANPRLLSRKQLSSLAGSGAARSPRSHISVRVRGNIELIPVSDIICFQAAEKYVSVCHSGGELLLDEPLKSLAEEFSRDFIRIHRNALVCKSRVTGMERDRGGHYLLRLQGAAGPLEISRRHVADVRKLLKERERPGS